MPYALRPLSLGELLDNTFDIYRRNFFLFLGISAIPNCALLLLQLAVKGTITADTPREVRLAGDFTRILLGLASFVVTYFVTAATTFGVSEIYLNIPTSFRACYARVGGKLLRIVVVSFVVAVIIGFGTSMCIVPGIYWTGKYGLAVPAVVLERLTWRQALERKEAFDIERMMSLMAPNELASGAAAQ